MTQRPDLRARPPRRSRFARFVAIALIVLLMLFFALGTAIAATGTVTVQFKEAGPDGVRLYLPVPALFLDFAVALAPLVIPTTPWPKPSGRSRPIARASKPWRRSSKTCRQASWSTSRAPASTCGSPRPGGRSRSTSRALTPTSTSRFRPGF